MAHLGADVAAFVDGQLSDASMQAASTHLDTCEECRKAVRQQSLLKSRMSTVTAPEPPPELLASLARLASAPAPHVGWWSRVRGSAAFRTGVVLVGASIAVVVAAYAVGSPDRVVGDEVSPPFDRYAAEFSGATTVQAANIISDSTMNNLDGSGWPCHAALAGGFRRTAGRYADHAAVVALSYSDGRSKLNLYEQNGALDRSSLAGFETMRVGESQVWVRAGVPLLVTWDDGGVVYTAVSDAARSQVEQAVADLPRGAYDESLTERVSDGLTRMTAWVGAA